MIITNDVDVANNANKAILLSKDGWDDYSYKTSFYVICFFSGESYDLGSVKIFSPYLDDDSSLSSRKEKTSTIVDNGIDCLPDGFFSLGQEIEYYRKLSEIGHEKGDEILKSLRDCAVFFTPDEKTQSHKAFWDSLLRGSEAKKCFQEGKLYYYGTQQQRRISFTYKAPIFEDEDEGITFDFDPFSDLPSTTNILIGKNGSGKTRLLGALAKDIVSGRNSKAFFPEIPPVSRVVAISYSVFDDFWVPNDSFYESYKDYKYLGLKRYEPNYEKYVIKTQEDYWDDVKVSLDALTQGRVDQELVDIVLGFVKLSHLVSLEDVEDIDSLEAIFRKMSSGQKISFSIICQIAAFLEDDSLVLFDEPENHLHPGLLWNMMVTFDKVLKKKRSYSVVATHSPIILQQIPSDYVNVVFKDSEIISSRKLDVENFGDNLQSIMEKVFGFVEPEHDYRAVIKSLINYKGYDIDKVESLFSKDLSLQARVFLSSAYKNFSNDKS